MTRSAGYLSCLAVTNAAAATTVGNRMIAMATMVDVHGDGGCSWSWWMIWFDVGWLMLHLDGV